MGAMHSHCPFSHSEIWGQSFCPACLAGSDTSAHHLLGKGAPSHHLIRETNMLALASLQPHKLQSYCPSNWPDKLKLQSPWLGQ